MLDLKVKSWLQIEASMNQRTDQQMPAYDLPSKILCRVINVLLKVIRCLIYMVAVLTLLSPAIVSSG